jgi:hypothetical protein
MEGIQKKGARATPFDGGHFGIYTVGVVTMYIIKNTCFVARPGPY